MAQNSNATGCLVSPSAEGCSREGKCKMTTQLISENLTLTGLKVSTFVQSFGLTRGLHNTNPCKLDPDHHTVSLLTCLRPRPCAVGKCSGETYLTRHIVEEKGNKSRVTAMLDGWNGKGWLPRFEFFTACG